jgi:hypothetical protein
MEVQFGAMQRMERAMHDCMQGQDLHNEKMKKKLGEMATKVDYIEGSLLNSTEGTMNVAPPPVGSHFNSQVVKRD